MENLVQATLDYLTYCASKEPRVKQHYPVAQATDFRKQQLEPRMMPMVEEVFDLIDFDDLDASPENRLLKELSKQYKSLYWRETSPSYAGTSFAQNYSACIFAAPNLDFWTCAHYHIDNLSIGFTVQRPNTLYPDHHHEALEIYATLYGKAEWRRGDGPYLEKEVGTIIYHEKNENHAIRTGDSYLISFYVWSGQLDCRPVVPNIPD